MLLIRLLSLVFLQLLYLCSASEDAKSNIFNGKSVEIKKSEDDHSSDFPYAAILEFKGKSICGSVIISKNAVVTSAHCVQNREAPELKIKAGIYFKDDKSKDKLQIRSVQNYKMHENFSKNVPREYDIAVILLEENLHLNNYVNIIQLSTAALRDSTYGEKVIILGWGRTEDGQKSNVLREAEMQLITKRKCQQLLTRDRINDSMICAIGIRKETGGCKGDSGGPLIKQSSKSGKKYSLIGINSFVIVNEQNANLCDPEFPTVFVDIVTVTPWINRILGIPNETPRNSKKKGILSWRLFKKSS